MTTRSGDKPERFYRSVPLVGRASWSWWWASKEKIELPRYCPLEPGSKLGGLYQLKHSKHENTVRT